MFTYPGIVYRQEFFPQLFRWWGGQPRGPQGIQLETVHITVATWSCLVSSGFLRGTDSQPAQTYGLGVSVIYTRGERARNISKYSFMVQQCG